MRRATAAPRQRALAKGDYETLAEFRYLLRRFGTFSEDAAREAGLTAQQHQALLAIKGFPARAEVTIGELAARLSLKHHSVVGLVNRLTRRGLIHRRHDLEDRRKVWIELTPQAEGMLLNLSLVHRAELRRLAPLLRGLLQKLENVGHRRG